MSVSLNWRRRTTSWRNHWNSWSKLTRNWRNQLKSLTIKISNRMDRISRWRRCRTQLMLLTTKFRIWGGKWNLPTVISQRLQKRKNPLLWMSKRLKAWSMSLKNLLSLSRTCKTVMRERCRIFKKPLSSIKITMSSHSTNLRKTTSRNSTLWNQSFNSWHVKTRIWTI